MIEASNLRRGAIFQYEGAPCVVVDVSFQSPTARGGNTLVKTRYRNLLTGQMLSAAFKSSDRFHEADFTRRKGQFLYASGDQGVFMDQESYEQYELGGAMYADVRGYLVDGCDVTLGVFNDQVVTLDVPQVVELTVTETAPAIRNATATAQTKEALLETGLTVQVPGYLEAGERIKVDTRECRFVSRA
ncbi:MAG: elongation factor P [Pelovirga sp.]